MVVQIQLLFSLIYLTALFLSIISFAIPYLYSLRPAKLSETRGEGAWKLCKQLRTIGTIFMVIVLIIMVLWIWFPIPALAWPINLNPWVGIILGAIVLIIPIPIWCRGLRDSGKECHEPSKDSQMFEGIYNHIRHPQTLGEISWFIAVPLIVNSLFLFAVSGIFLIIYIPIMIHVEEKDLIRRFGNAYREYKKRTGALIPKWRKPKPT
jgi:protein-S-isoprenylcysteine O-methyltransferase Ste14